MKENPWLKSKPFCLVFVFNFHYTHFHAISHFGHFGHFTLLCHPPMDDPVLPPLPTISFRLDDPKKRIVTGFLNYFSPNHWHIFSTFSSKTQFCQFSPILGWPWVPPHLLRHYSVSQKYSTSYSPNMGQIGQEKKAEMAHHCLQIMKNLHFLSPPCQRTKIRYLPPKDQQRQWQNGCWTFL